MVEPLPSFAPPVEAAEFAAAVRQMLVRDCGVDALRAAWDSADGRLLDVEKSLAAFGVWDLDLATAVPVFTELGRACAPIAVGPAAAAARALGPRGEEIAAFTDRGHTAAVIGARWADVFLVADGGTGLRRLDRSDVTVTPVTSLDSGVGLGSVRWEPGAGTAVAGTDAAAAYDDGCVATAAYVLGLAEAMLDMAVDYAKAREQFGRPIGTFQAVKHQLADVYVGNAFAGPVVRRAAGAVTSGDSAASLLASHAMLAAGSAARQAARTALQVHAAIGYTYEHELHMWLKRTWSLTTLWGTEAEHRARAAAFLAS